MIRALLFSVTCFCTASAAAQGAGISVERHRAPRTEAVPVGNQVITVVRVDPDQFDVVFLGEGHEGPRRPIDEWAKDYDLVAAINAGMFMPSGRTVGFQRYRGSVRSGRRPSKFSAAIGFAPGVVRVGGRGCPKNLSWFHQNERTFLQARALILDCKGRAVPWNNRRRYSVAAVGVDEQGRIVLLHSRTPYSMDVFGKILSKLDLGIRGLAFMEGGPEASLFVSSGKVEVSEMGSWEDGFNPNDRETVFWDLPNVIGLVRRSRP